ncbi:unnamed protein product [Phytophthora lilii]|uniref:Unnamed protein product n=1 Tax=Phytophthora lilii TaxID=2077276 RepID=A0A9W6WNG6_9STRA|nr:unnamed protein product [Phytophthora lilii]
MDFLNKAKEALSGGDSSKKSDDKKSDSIFSKAMEAAEKYQAKEKVAEFAQKRVAKREEEKLKPGYVEKKEKSVVDKAVEAAEDFLAKQGQPKPQETVVVKDNNACRSRASSSSSSSSSGFEKCSHKKDCRPQNVPNEQPVYPPSAGVGSSYPSNAPTSNGTYPANPSPANNPSYPSVRAENKTYDAFSRMNLGNNDGSRSRPEATYDQPRAQADPYRNTEGYRSYDESSRNAPSYRPNIPDAPASYPAAVGGGNSYPPTAPDSYSGYPADASRSSNPSRDGSRHETYEEYWSRQGNTNQRNEAYPGYSSGATGASYGAAGASYGAAGASYGAAGASYGAAGASYGAAGANYGAAGASGYGQPGNPSVDAYGARDAYGNTSQPTHSNGVNGYGGNRAYGAYPSAYDDHV